MEVVLLWFHDDEEAQLPQTQRELIGDNHTCILYPIKYSRVSDFLVTVTAHFCHFTFFDRLYILPLPLPILFKYVVYLLFLECYTLYSHS